MPKKGRGKGKGKASRDSSSDDDSPARKRSTKTPEVPPAKDIQMILQPPLTSNVDANQYKMLILSNGIRVLLISEDSSSRLPSWCHRPSHVLGLKTFDAEKQSLMLMEKPFLSMFATDAWGTAPIPSTMSGNDILGCGTDHVPFDIPIDEQKKKTKGKGPKNSRPEMSFVALTVNVGGADDPPTHCGLAHFLEHMVHLGSEAYPDEDAYFRWMLEHGQSVNAFTQSNTTSYHFGCFDSALETSIDLFSSMLAEPLLLESTVEREVESVDNEYLLKEHHPVWMWMQILASSAKENHPLNSFFCGNLKSLKKGKKDVKDLTKQLKAFHQKHYVGSGMTLTIQSTLSLGELETLVTSASFDKIPKGNGNIRRDTVVEKHLLDPFNTPAFNRFNFIPNKHNLNLMWMAWPLPPDAWRDFQNKPLDFISHLLSLELEGGLFHTLRNSGLVFHVSAGCSRHEWCRNEYCSIFEVRLMLTEDGMELESMKSLMKNVYQGLQTIRDMPIKVKTALWDEFYSTLKQEFDYSGPGSGDSFALSCSRLLQVMPSEQIFRSEGYPSKKFDNTVFRKTLAFLQPEKMNISVCSSLFPESVSKVMGKKRFEKFTKTEYYQCSLEDLNGTQGEDFLKELQKCKKLDTKFPTDKNAFELRDIPTSAVINPYEFGAGKMKLEHYGNQQNTVCKSVCSVQFITASNRFNEKRQILLSMMAQCIQEAVLPLYSDMERAGLQVFVIPRPHSLTFEFQGFAVPLVEAVRQMLTAAWNAMSDIEEETFNLVKEAFVAFHKERLASPQKIAWSLISEVFVKEKIHIEDELKVLGKLEFIDLLNYSELFKNSCAARIAVEGNIDAAQTQQIAEIVSGLDFSPLATDLSRLYIPVELVSLPLEDRCIRVRSNCRTCVNTSVTNIYGFKPSQGQNNNLSEMVDITAFLMRGASFWYLRTWNQLGYAVNVEYLTVKDPMIKVSVTGPASKISACLLDEFMDSFLNVFWDMCLKDLDEGYLNQLKRMWGFRGNITANDLQHWYKNQLLPIIERDENKLCTWDNETAGRLRVSKLSVQVLGHDDEKCKGHKQCAKSTGLKTPFKDGTNGKHLSFAEDKDSADKYFISNIKAYKNLI